MASYEYERIVRELMENRDFLNAEEREAFKPYVIQGIPQNQRANFWNICTGIHMYQRGYCENYYEVLQDSV